MAHLLSRQAEDDLDEIWFYVVQESGSLERADRLIDRLTERVYMLARNPYLGRDRSRDLRADLRSFPMGEWVIFYRLDQQNEAGVIILRILSGRRDLDAVLR